MLTKYLKAANSKLINFQLSGVSMQELYVLLNTFFECNYESIKHQNLSSSSQLIFL